MKLKDKAIKAEKPGSRLKKLFDGNGLILLVHPNGSKYWSFKYRHLDKEKSLALGKYPDVGLAEARQKLIEVRKMVLEGRDPSESRKAAKRSALVSAENTFEVIAREWLEARRAGWTPRYSEFMRKRLEKDLFPRLGTRPMKEITAPEILSVVKVIQDRGATELAGRAMQYCSQIFMFGVATGRVEQNPAVSLKGALKTHVKKHYAHLTEVDMPEFVQKLEAFNDINLQTKLALKLLLLTFLRTVELRGATWDEVDFEKAEWRICAERMKMRRDHIVPLSKQAIMALKELKILNGKWQYVFPQEHKPIKCMSENAILYALYRMGYKNRTTGHGFRHTASTILNERGFNRDHVELQLAHVDNKVRGVYNHASWLPERRKMMQWWADYLDELKVNSSDVIPLRSGTKV